MWLGVVLGAGLTTACSSEIGDECALNSDCSTDGTRSCDTASSGGYCTIVGCDFDTCPEEAVCVRFYVGGASNRTCAPATEDLPSGGTNDCALDDACSLSGVCVPRSSEVRYCMRTCGDCRDGYECRDGALMRDHGGEPVPPPGERLGDNPQPFCAQAPSDRDGDGILDDVDECPDDPEDVDGFEDQDGCPEPELSSSSIE